MSAVHRRSRAGVSLVRFWIGACAALLVAAASDTAIAQSAPTEASVEAAYLYKFLAYVNWPVEASGPGDSPIVVGVAGSEAVHAELQALTVGRAVDGRSIQTRRVRDGDSVDGLHALYVGKAAGAGALREWSHRLRGRPVLIVTDVPDGLQSGAMLGLVPVDGRIRFVASVSAAEQAGLRLSARLLAVADRVVAR